VSQRIKYTLFQRPDNKLAGAISFAAPVVHSLPKEKSIFKSCLQGFIFFSLYAVCGTFLVYKSRLKR